MIQHFCFPNMRMKFIYILLIGSKYINMEYLYVTFVVQ